MQTNNSLGSLHCVHHLQLHDDGLRHDYIFDHRDVDDYHRDFVELDNDYIDCVDSDDDDLIGFVAGNDALVTCYDFDDCHELETSTSITTTSG